MQPDNNSAKAKYRVGDSAVDAVDLEVHKQQFGLLGNSLGGRSLGCTGGLG